MKHQNEAQELRKHLFKQLERLENPQCNLEMELKKADALSKVGTVIVNSHKQEIDLLKLAGRKSGKIKTIDLKPVRRKQLAHG